MPLFLVLGLLGCGAPEHQATIDLPPEPPVDVSRPVENPALVQALGVREVGRPVDQQASLVRELNRAVYLLPVPAEGAPATTRVIMYRDGRGGDWVPLFTDWQQMRAWTQRPVQPLVLPAGAAWDFALRDESAAGAVIDPAAYRLSLDRETLERLKNEAAPDARR